MELLKFIFQSFWHFVGFLIILSIALTFLVELIKAIMPYESSKKEEKLKKEKKKKDKNYFIDPILTEPPPEMND